MVVGTFDDEVDLRQEIILVIIWAACHRRLISEEPSIVLPGPKRRSFKIVLAVSEEPSIALPAKQAVNIRVAAGRGCRDAHRDHDCQHPRVVPRSQSPVGGPRQASMCIYAIQANTRRPPLFMCFGGAEGFEASNHSQYLMLMVMHSNTSIFFY